MGWDMSKRALNLVPDEVRPAAQLAGFVPSLMAEWQWAMKASASPGCAAVAFSRSQYRRPTVRPRLRP
jgi:hypothetical protein